MSKFQLGGVPSHAHNHFRTLRDKVCGGNGQDWSDALEVLLAQVDPVKAKGLLSASNVAEPKYPLYLMKADNKFQLLPINDAGILYDNGFVRVDFGGFVLEEGQKIRPMTDDEKRKISDIADAYSASK